MDGLTSRPVFPEAELCFPKARIDKRRKFFLDESGINFLSCIKESDGAIVFRQGRVALLKNINYFAEVPGLR